MAKKNFAAVIAAITILAILLTVFAGCNKEKTPEEEFSLAKEEVNVVQTKNFYCFKEFFKNVVLKEERINVEDLFIKIGNDGIKVHVLSEDKIYTVYTVESSQTWEIARAITSENNFIYLASHDNEGNEIYLQNSFDDAIWNAHYDVEGDHIIFEP